MVRKKMATEMSIDVSSMRGRAPKAMILAASVTLLKKRKQLWPALSTFSPTKTEDRVDAMEKTEKMKPVQIVEMPLSAKNVGKKGAGSP